MSNRRRLKVDTSEEQRWLAEVDASDLPAEAKEMAATLAFLSAANDGKVTTDDIEDFYGFERGSLRRS